MQKVAPIPIQLFLLARTQRLSTGYTGGGGGQKELHHDGIKKAITSKYLLSMVRDGIKNVRRNVKKYVVTSKCTSSRQEVPHNAHHDVISKRTSRRQKLCKIGRHDLTKYGKYCTPCCHNVKKYAVTSKVYHRVRKYVMTLKSTPRHQKACHI